MLVLWGIKGKIGRLVAKNEMSIEFLMRLQRHLPHYKRFALLRILRRMTGGTLGELKVQSESDIGSTKKNRPRSRAI